MGDFVSNGNECGNYYAGWDLGLGLRGTQLEAT